jgi:hypothetical protein
MCRHVCQLDIQTHGQAARFCFPIVYISNSLTFSLVAYLKSLDSLWMVYRSSFEEHLLEAEEDGKKRCCYPSISEYEIFIFVILYYVS